MAYQPSPNIKRSYFDTLKFKFFAAGRAPIGQGLYGKNDWFVNRPYCTYEWQFGESEHTPGFGTTTEITGSKKIVHRRFVVRLNTDDRNECADLIIPVSIHGEASEAPWF